MVVHPAIAIESGFAALVPLVAGGHLASVIERFSSSRQFSAQALSFWLGLSLFLVFLGLFRFRLAFFFR
jgi:hypothetical protein